MSKTYDEHKQRQFHTSHKYLKMKLQSWDFHVFWRSFRKYRYHPSFTFWIKNKNQPTLWKVFKRLNIYSHMYFAVLTGTSTFSIKGISQTKIMQCLPSHHCFMRHQLPSKIWSNCNFSLKMTREIQHLTKCVISITLNKIE